MKKYLEIYPKTWKYHGILSVRKRGNPVSRLGFNESSIASDIAALMLIVGVNRPLEVEVLS